MRLALCADIHLGNHRRFGGGWKAGLNARAWLIIETWRRAVTLARERRTSVLAVAGDLFDASDPTPQLVTAVEASLPPEGDGLDTVVFMPGNHDQVSQAPGDNALGPLHYTLSGVRVETPGHFRQKGDDVLFVPFQPGRVIDYLPHVVARAWPQPARDENRVLVIHAGVYDGETPGYLRDSHDAIHADQLLSLAVNYGAQAVFAGNWHGRRFWDAVGKVGFDVVPVGAQAAGGGKVKPPFICQIGALCPTGFDNPGLLGYGTLVVWDTKARLLEVHEVPGPRFINLAQMALDGPAVAQAREHGCTIYARWEAPQEQYPEALATMAAAVAKGIIKDGEVTPDKKEAIIAARTAATMARSAETFEEALAGYVEQMQVPDGVDRKAVLARVTKYLGGG